MIQDRLIVCVASCWDYDPTSKHHLMRILSKHNEILWVNYHGSRRPEVTRTDLIDTWGALRRVVKGLERVSDTMTQFTPLVIPGAANPCLALAHRRMLLAQIRRAVRAVRRSSEQPIQVWSFAPDVPYLIGALGEECFVYYCVDDYRQFAGFDAHRIAEAENDLVDRADIVVTTSAALLASKRTIRPDAVLVRHGVDFDHFASAWRRPPDPPADLASVPRPIFGFFGLVHHWIDCKLLAEVARLRPDYSFVFIGDCKVNVSELAALDNVYFPGRRPYAQLPAYCAAFDAAMLPFTTDAMTRSINPVKMYEYIAAGLPVVSTPLPEAAHLPQAVTIADTPQRFAEACDRALTDDCTKGEELSRIVAHETWAVKVEYLSDLIAARTRGVLRTASMPASLVTPRERVRRPVVEPSV